MGELRLHLVRHGRPLVDPERPASTWELDPAGFDDVWDLRAAMPRAAAWFCSPEPKAIETAQLLTDGEVAIVEGLAELRRPDFWDPVYETSVERAFARPDGPAAPGWESVAECRDRLRRAVLPLRRTLTGDVVLIGHGLAWTVLAADLEDRAPTAAAWRGWRMPEVRVIGVSALG